MDDTQRAVTRLALSPEDEAALRAAGMLPNPETIAPSGYMSPPVVNQQLDRAAQLIQTQDKAAARRVLAATSPYAVRNARFWWLLAHAAGSKRVAILALTHVVELRPRMGKAWQALAHLDAQTARKLYQTLRPPRRRWRLRR